MLPSNYRFVVKNETTITSGAVSVKIKRWKLNTDGTITYDAETTVFSAASITNGTFNTAGATPQSNSGNWQGFDWFVTVVNGTAAGTYAVFLERSTDGGTTWPTAGESEFIDSINVAASQTESRSGSF